MIKVLIRSLVSILVFVTDFVYRNRPYPRFYVLETIARVPYFAYLSVLHFYETLGFWRKADWLKVHFAETWNELRLPVSNRKLCKRLRVLMRSLW